MRLRTRRRSAGRTVPLEGESVAWAGSVATVWDEHAPRLHRARMAGPVRVTFAVPVELEHARRGLIARERSDGPRGAGVVLCGGELLEVRR